MAGHSVHQLEEAAQERFLRLGEQRHIHRTLSATQHRAQGDHQQFVEVMQTSIAGSRVLQTFPARDELIQRILPRQVSHLDR